MNRIENPAKNKYIKYAVACLLSFLIVSICTATYIQAAFLSIIVGWIFCSPALIDEIKNSKIYNYVIKYLPPVLFLALYIFLCKPNIALIITSLVISLIVYFEFCISSRPLTGAFVVLSPLIIIYFSEFIIGNPDAYKIMFSSAACDNEFKLFTLANSGYMIRAFLVYVITGVATFIQKNKDRSHLTTGIVIMLIAMFRKIAFDVSRIAMSVFNIKTVLPYFKGFNIESYVRTNIKWLLISALLIFVYVLICSFCTTKDSYYGKQRTIIKGAISLVLTVFVISLILLVPEIKLLLTL